jgi:predicted small secreted protein
MNPFTRFRKDQRTLWQVRIPALCMFLGASMLLAGCATTTGQGRAARSFDRTFALEDTAATSATISVGDVNADGHQDIVLIKGRHWPLANLVRLGNGDGTFQPAYPLGEQPDRSYSGVLVDMDNDGDLDIVVSNDSPDPKFVYLNDGRGRFTPGSTFGKAGWPTRHITVVDLNGDRLPDIVLANRYGKKPGPSYLCFGVKGGRVADECVAFSQGSATTIKAADVNGDGFADLVVPYRDRGQSFVWLNDGKGGFAARRPFGPADATIRSVEPIDLDGDGVMDLVAIDEERGPAIFRGRPDGSYSGAEAFGTPGARPYAILVADLDRNGRPDVIVGYVKSRPVVYFNDGPGAFHGVPFGDSEGTTYGFAVGDLDEDGFLDIAMARSDARNMLYFGAPAKAL